MTRIGAAASIVALAFLGLAGVASAQSAAMTSGPSAAAGSIASAPSSGGFGTRSPAFGAPAWEGLGFGDITDGRHRRNGPGRPDRPGSRYRQGYSYPVFYGHGGGIDALIPPDLGYFSTGGEAWRGRDGQVDYDYDRGYPYDYYRPRGHREVAYEAAPRERYCETVWARGGGSGNGVPVRICRN